MAIVETCVPQGPQARMAPQILNETSNIGVVMSFNVLGELGYRFEYYITVMGRGRGEMVERGEGDGRVQYLRGPFEHMGVRYHVYNV